MNFTNNSFLGLFFAFILFFSGCGQISDQLGFTNKVLIDAPLRSTVLPPLFKWKYENSSNYQFGEEGIKIKLEEGTLHSEENNVSNLLLRPIPDGADAFFAWVGAGPTKPGGQAGLILYNDDDNYVIVSIFRGDRKLKYIMSSEHDGHHHYGRVKALRESGSGLILKLGEDHNIYGLEKGLNGKIGHVGQSALKITNNTKIGFIAQGGNPDVEEWATFTDFKITKNTVYRRD